MVRRRLGTTLLVLGLALSLAGAVASIAAESALTLYGLVVAGLTGVLATVALVVARGAGARGAAGARPWGLHPVARLRLVGLALALVALGWVVVSARQRIGFAVVVAGGLLLLLASGGPRERAGSRG